MKLSDFVVTDAIVVDLQATTKEAAIREIIGSLLAAGCLAESDQESVIRAILNREELGSTGIGQGVAIPHCKLNDLRQSLVAVGLVPEGVEFGAVDGQPVKVFFLVVSPGGSPAQHLQALAAISRWIKADGNAGRLLGLHDATRVYDLLRDENG
jgi:mannitol/fructose-specific phosphotransferase system IIA component (Ntr-type)